MANTGLWLRGAKGKFAGAVLQKGEKGTILRDHVTPSNPRSNAQMTSRMVFGVVSKAAAELADLVGISFQGVSSIKESKRIFRGENMSMLINNAKADSNSVTFAPKGYSVLIPNNYLVAKGTLTNARFGDITSYSQGQVLPQFIQSNVGFQLVNGRYYSAAEMIKLIWGCQPGDQVTVIAIGRDDTVLAEYPEYYQKLYACKMKSARIVFKSESELAQLDPFIVSFVSTISPSAMALALQEYLVDVFASGKCNADFFMKATIADHFYLDHYDADTKIIQMHWNCSSDDNNFHTFADMLFPSLGFAVGYFRSRYNESTASWNFSRCQLVRLDPVYTLEAWQNEDPIYGVSYDLALASYVAEAINSDRYTETGGSDNQINI